MPTYEDYNKNIHPFRHLFNGPYLPSDKELEALLPEAERKRRANKPVVISAEYSHEMTKEQCDAFSDRLRKIELELTEQLNELKAQAKIVKPFEPKPGTPYACIDFDGIKGEFFPSDVTERNLPIYQLGYFGNGDCFPTKEQASKRATQMQAFMYCMAVADRINAKSKDPHPCYTPTSSWSKPAEWCSTVIKLDGNFAPHAFAFDTEEDCELFIRSVGFERLSILQGA